jgi:hypothetical protein
MSYFALHVAGRDCSKIPISSISENLEASDAVGKTDMGKGLGSP